MLGNTNITIKPNEKVDYVDWIESTGTQWIDTGVLMTETKMIEVDFQTTVYTSGTNNTIVSGYTDGKGVVFGIQGSTNSFRFAYGSQWNGSTVAYDLNRHKIVINTPEKTCLFDNTVLATESDIVNLNGEANIYLLQFLNQYYGYAKIYNCKIWDNNILIHNFRPCKDPDGIFCLYDTVTKKYFYNKGTGYFEGPNPKQVEYIESSGTQYIDTLLAPSVNTEVDIKYQTLSRKEYGPHILSAGNWFTPFPRQSDNAFFGTWCGSSISAAHLYDANTIYTVKAFPNNKLSINETLYDVTKGTAALSGTFHIFTYGLEPTNTNYLGNVRVYYCKIYDNNELVRNFIPVYIGTYCLYDTINKKYYYNKGTGNFTGADSLFSGDTVCLLNFEDNLTDDTGLNAVTMSAGEAVYVDGKFNKSIKLDGSAYVSIPLTENNTLGTNDFTIAGWFKFDKNTGNQDLFSHNYNYSSSYYWQGLAVWRSDGYKGLCFHCDLSATTKNRCNTEVDVEANKWYHVALVRSNGVVKLYLNGTSIGSLSANGTVYQNTNATWKIGSSSLTSDNPNIREPFYGQVDNFMIINGKALWTANFTTPDSPYGTSEV